MAIKRLRERRFHHRQREAVEQVVDAGTGVVALTRAPDGSVYVYDEHREWKPPTTLRIRITPAGDVEPPDRLRLSPT
jgi:hypothetical protein